MPGGAAGSTIGACRSAFSSPTPASMSRRTRSPRRSPSSFWLHGHSVQTAAADRVADIEPYAAVVLGSAVYANRWRASATRFLRRHREALGQRPLWIFTSGPLDPDDDRDHTPARVRRRLNEPVPPRFFDALPFGADPPTRSGGD